jgi:pimeloyl-ACP methyl ester carboxylesterase
MISPVSEFKLLERGFDKSVVLIPGWASDYRIFDALDLNYNYVLPVGGNPFNFAEDLLEFLNRKLPGKVSLFGWSMGGFMASDFASKNPEKVEELILVSVQKKYDPKILEEIKLKLKQNKKGFLFWLYSNCFSEKDKEGADWFKQHLLETYTEELSLEELTSGLDYLSKTQINPVSLAKIKRIRIFHGEEDKIAVYDAAHQIKLELSQAKLICLPGIGHTPFLNKQFKEVFLYE